MLTREPPTGRDDEMARPARTIDRIVGAALRLALEPSLSQADRLTELLAIADFDTELLRPARFRLNLEALHCPSRTAAEAARLLSLALELGTALSKTEVARA